MTKRATFEVSPAQRHPYKVIEAKPAKKKKTIELTNHDILRLADAILENIRWDEDSVDQWSYCRYCGSLFIKEGHSYDCVVLIARKVKEVKQ